MSAPTELTDVQLTMLRAVIDDLLVINGVDHLIQRATPEQAAPVIMDAMVRAAGGDRRDAVAALRALADAAEHAVPPAAPEIERFLVELDAAPWSSAEVKQQALAWRRTDPPAAVSRAIAIRRTCMLADFAVRHVVPLALDDAGMLGTADALRRRPRLADRAQFWALGEVLAEAIEVSWMLPMEKSNAARGAASFASKASAAVAGCMLEDAATAAGVCVREAASVGGDDLLLAAVEMARRAASLR